ncbi:MAG: hypothetical protein LBB76_01295 [Azoarcus sp.]|jgi:hypothetical protein|nr:hypothetical protein [Azoarcus sp.]
MNIRALASRLFNPWASSALSGGLAVRLALAAMAACLLWAVIAWALSPSWSSMPI